MPRLWIHLHPFKTFWWTGLKILSFICIIAIYFNVWKLTTLVKLNKMKKIMKSIPSKTNTKSNTPPVYSLLNWLTYVKIIQPDTYGCPQCNAPKKRFARYDVKSGKAVGGALPPIPVLVALVAGIAGVGALLVYGLQ